MRMSQILGIGGLALCALCSGPAKAERESGETTSGFEFEGSHLTGGGGCPAADAQSCDIDQMRWDLCVRGLGARRRSGSEIEQCFLRSN